jgi:Zn-dependent peptidase ImmA (M78 family)
MVLRVDVAPGLFRWARQRSGRSVSDYPAFPKLAEWEAGSSRPTMRQLEDYAQATHTPIGFFFLPTPPVEQLPIPDFRTLGDQPVLTPTPDLLDTVYACEQRQEWYRDFALANGYDTVGLVGSLTEDVDPLDAAARLRDALGFGLARRVDFGNWTEALGGLIEHAETAGVLVMVNGVVGTNTHRRLNPEEFRGFALVDDYAPVVFVNGADTKAAQIFTLAHELAHVALGGSGVSRPDLAELVRAANTTERWCNQVAAELLVPIESIRQEFSGAGDFTAELDRLARFYRVSTLVVLRRIFDAGLMPRDRYRDAYRDELGRVLDLAASRGSGGNFYYTQPIRVSKTFARALISDTREGRTLYRDAFRMLGSRKVSSFEELGKHLGVA